MNDILDVKKRSLRENILKILRNNYIIPVFLVIIAFVIRYPSFGNPFYHVDEVFYLLVGDKILHGFIPYIDIWDRKPIGLFLIYAFIRSLGGDGIIQYQIVSCIFAASTAVIISLFTFPKSTGLSRLGSGLLYLVWINFFLGGGGQAPVFYNFFMALSALLIFRSLQPLQQDKKLQKNIIAMLLVGCSIQIKYTAVFEGFYFGLFILYNDFKKFRSFSKVFFRVLIYVLCSLFPTIIFITYYISIGYGKEYIFANFISLFLRSPNGSDQDIAFIVTAVKFLFPLLAITIFGLLNLFSDKNRRKSDYFLLGWIVSSIVGALGIGNYYIHYWLPVMVPLSIGAAAAIEGIWGLLLLMSVVAIPLYQSGWPRWHEAPEMRRSMEHLASVARPYITRRHCLYVYDGSPWLYQMTNSCLPTPYIFPEHLNFAVEENAIGVSPEAEISRVLSREPGAIIFPVIPIVAKPNLRTRAILLKALEEKYRLVDKQNIDGREVRIFALSKLREH